MRRILAALLLLAAPVAALGGGFEALEGEVRERKLANGLQVIVLPRHDAPVASFVTLFGVGSAHERVGVTGVAHVFEHMAFKGTREIGTRDYAKEEPLLARIEAAFEALRAERLKGPKADSKRLEALERAFREAQAAAAPLSRGEELSVILERHGAQGLNAATGLDYTIYLVDLPANRLELWFVLEADRFKNAVLREFFKEKEVILEERRMRVESSPQGKMIEEGLSVAFKAHPYKEPTIGHRADIESLSPAQARDFFRTHYTPRNTIIAIAGDVDPEEVFRLAERHFGDIPKGPEPEPMVTVEPPQEGERRATVETLHQPVVAAGWHRPAASHPDDPVYDVIAEILAGGRSARLDRAIRQEKRLALGVECYAAFPGARWPPLFLAFAMNAPGRTNAELLDALLSEIDRLKEEPVTEAELSAAKRRLRVGLIRGLGSNGGLARQLAMSSLIYGDWREMFRSLERIDKATAEDVRRVARETFTRRNRTIMELVAPEEKGK